MGHAMSLLASPPRRRRLAPHPRPCPGWGADTLHVEFAVWSGTYRIIQTRPDGSRSVWRRGIETLEEARLRATIVADICGYEAVTK